MPKKKRATTRKSSDFNNPDLFLKAARAGDLKTVNKLLRAGIDPDICHPTPEPTDSEIGAYEHASSDI